MTETLSELVNDWLKQRGIDETKSLRSFAISAGLSEDELLSGGSSKLEEWVSSLSTKDLKSLLSIVEN